MFLPGRRSANRRDLLHGLRSSSILAHMPSTDAYSFDAQLKGNRIRIRGSLDERVNFDDLIKRLSPLSSSKEPVIFELQDFSFMNSGGLIKWVRFIEQIPNPVIYENCPVWLVYIFNMVGNFFYRSNIAVRSIYAPFYCEELDQTLNILIQIGRDLPLKADYKKFKFESIEKDGKLFEPDFHPESYFRFLAAHHVKFGYLLSDK